MAAKLSEGELAAARLVFDTLSEREWQAIALLHYERLAPHQVGAIVGMSAERVRTLDPRDVTELLRKAMD